MANRKDCKKCGEAIQPVSPHATNKKFCTKDCYENWWNEKRSNNVTRREWYENRWGPLPDKELTSTECAWLAGFIDGEGTLGIYRSKFEKNTSGWKYAPVVSVCNTNKQMIDHFCALTDCWVTLKKRKRESPNRNVWIAEIKHQKLGTFLPKIMKYLVGKKEQAEIVMEFVEEMGDAPMRSSRVHDKFEDLYFKTKKLNRRGRKAKEAVAA